MNAYMTSKITDYLSHFLLSVIAYKQMTKTFYINVRVYGKVEQ